jgi:hypothetical protein
MGEDSILIVLREKLKVIFDMTLDLKQRAYLVVIYVLE